MSPPAKQSLPPNSAPSIDGEFDALVCEVSENIDNGARVELDDYAEQHPEFADRLRRIWPTLLAMADLGHLNHEENEADVAKTPHVGILGDFQIIREVGRGGMGVVYEATQISLGRRVALKVLPFASVMDRRQLQRFKNEAMAAAALDHPNIVSVHATGCERSVHYYAMHYVEGLTIAEVIAQLRAAAGKNPSGRTAEAAAEPTIQFRPGAAPPQSNPPSASPSGETDKALQVAISTEGSIRTHEYFRSVAEIGKQAAEALDYAHGVGIVHRDVKPSNLILDGAGVCWVTDFGLAMVESSPNLTMTGDLLGTLRYMSPEQSLAQRVVVDHRTDVYSLGVTLYELLTLQPAHTGNDRQELLRRLAFEEPNAPRKLNSKIPEDLETVVLKAIAKNPAERFATAGDLATDLGRYINGEPIQARRPTLVKRLGKWSLRNKPIVGAAAVLVLLTTLGLGVSNVLIAEQRNAAVAASENEKKQREEAQLQRDKARENFYLAEMRQAAYDLSLGSHHRLQESLQRHIPEQGQTDLRQWEWYYLQSMTPDELVGLRRPRTWPSISWSSQPLRLLTAGFDDRVTLWNPEQRNPVEFLDNPASGAACTLSPDGKHLATCDWDGLVHVWDFSKRRVVATLKPESEEADRHGWIRWMGWRPDGKSLAVLYDKTLIVWDVQTRSRQPTYSVATTPYDRAFPKWSPDGTRIAMASKRNRLWVWNMADEPVFRDLPETTIMDFVWSPDSSTIVTGEDSSKGNGVRFRDSQTLKLLRTLPAEDHSEKVWALAWSPDGKLLATGNEHATVDIWNPATGERLHHLSGHRGPLTRVVWSLDGKLLASGGRDHTVHVWDVDTGKLLRTFQGHEGEVQILSFSPTGRFLVSCSYTDQGTLKLWDVAQTSTLELRLPAKPDQTAPSPDGERFVTAHETKITIWDAKTGTSLRSLDLAKLQKPGGAERSEPAAGNYQPANWRSLGWSPDGRHIAWATKEGICSWDVSTDWRIDFFALPVDKYRGDEPHRVGVYAWSQNYSHLAVNLGGDIWILDALHAKTLGRLNAAEPVSSLAWSDDGKLASGSDNETIRIWDPDQGQLLHVLSDVIDPYGGSVDCLAWSPDGRKLASAAYWDHSIKIWDAQIGRLLHSMPGHVGGITSMAWHPTNRRLATFAQDGTARIWDTEAGQEVLTLESAFNNALVVKGIVWSGDGQRLQAIDDQRLIQSWDARAGYERASRQLTDVEKEEIDARLRQSLTQWGSWATGQRPAVRTTPDKGDWLVAATNFHQQGLSAAQRGKRQEAIRNFLRERDALQRIKGLSGGYHSKHTLRQIDRRLLALGEELYQLERWNEAQEAFEAVIKSHVPTGVADRHARWLHTLSLAKLGEFSDAQREYQQLVEEIRLAGGDDSLSSWETNLTTELNELLTAKSDPEQPTHVMVKELLLAGANRRASDFAVKCLSEAVESSETMREWQLTKEHVQYCEQGDFTVARRPTLVGRRFSGNGFGLAPRLLFAASKPITVEVICSLEKYEARSQHLLSWAQRGGLFIQAVQWPRDVDWQAWSLGIGSESSNNLRWNFTDSDQQIPLGRRQHVAGVWDGESLKLYVDGEFARETHAPREDVGRRITGVPMMLGADPNYDFGPETTGFFHGIISAARVTNAAVYDEEFASPKTLKPLPETVGLFDFRYDDGDLAYDRSGQGNHMILVNAERVEGD